MLTSDRSHFFGGQEEEEDIGLTLEAQIEALKRHWAKGKELEARVSSLMEAEEWKREAEVMVAGIPDSADLLSALLKTPSVKEAQEILSQVVELVTSKAQAEVKPKVPPTTTEKVTETPSTYIEDATHLIKRMPGSPKEREELETSLQALRQELDRPHPRWLEVRKHVITLAGSDKEIFFAVLPWLLEAPETIS
ncbi:MAG: hypothetical protein HY664_01380 [Chloroflexi bacterium]|nr:hypothetical protein [Chloroflexota bacterium]